MLAQYICTYFHAHSILWRCNLHTVKCANLKCVTWWILMPQIFLKHWRVQENMPLGCIWPWTPPFMTPSLMYFVTPMSMVGCLHNHIPWRRGQTLGEDSVITPLLSQLRRRLRSPGCEIALPLAVWLRANYFTSLMLVFPTDKMRKIMITNLIELLD